MKKKIFILLGHPDKNSITHLFAEKYAEGARSSGHEVSVAHIGELEFDPVLWKGYDEVQELEPDLKKVQECIKGADHLVFVYPIWWGTMPGILKGMFDRIFLPGFAFNFNDKGVLWEKLFKGKSARVIVTLDNYRFLQRILFGDFTDEIRRSILWFSGVSPARTTVVSRVSHLSEKKKEKWAKKIKKLGERGD